MPEIDEDPYSGTTVGLIPTFLVTDDRNEIHQIIAPDAIYNQYFGYGARGRVYSYPSDNTQWSIVGGAKERVESEFDGEYAAGLLRQDLLSFDLSLVYDRDGSPRYYGLGNNAPEWHATNFTYQQKYLQSILGFNVTHAWQIGYTFRARQVEITPGHITAIPSIQALFPDAINRGDRQEILNRVSITYDSRDSLTAPTRGAEWVLYAGAASDEGLLNATLYSEAGIDGRNFWSLGDNAVLAVHFALRYMPGNDRTRAIPFWALGSIGGDESIVGGDQPLRGYGTGRWVDRNMSSMSVEYRYRIATIDAFSTQVSVELTPFVDMGRVFDLMGDDPLSQLHKDTGVGLRALALPYVVGYLDVGYGTEGTAIFTGLNYPF
ncbi:MAG TPA: BamA/TamA family outer membrane protein [Steroidobacteraceae bacterium]|nr:BamA/TamA family outer membrane protein [Steroidobacteraceae bacterium]